MGYREEEVVVLGGLGCWAVVSLLILLLTVLYLATLARALAACSLARRTFAPGLVWLNLLPVFHLVWKFVTAAQVADSLRREYVARGMRAGYSFGRAVGGLVPAVAVFTRFVFWGGMFFARIILEEVAGFFVLFATATLGVLELILLIVHWGQISRFAKPLGESDAVGNAAVVEDDRGERHFDEDYRPMTRPRGVRDAG